MEDQKSDKIISFIKLRGFIRNATLTPLEKCLFINLIFYAGINGEAFPSEESLGKDLGFSTRHIRTQLKKLQQKSWIVKKQQRGYSKSNLYQLNQELYFHSDNSDRNASSSHLGNRVPTQIGSVLPTKENKESNQLSVVQQLFKKTANKECSKIELNQLHKLCEQHSTIWVEDAIKEAGTRNYPYITVKLISLILEDWKRDGKPPEKPKFVTCNKDGCENGYIFIPGQNSATICECKEKFEQELEEWKKQWGGYHA